MRGEQYLVHVGFCIHGWHDCLQLYMGGIPGACLDQCYYHVHFPNEQYLVHVGVCIHGWHPHIKLHVGGILGAYATSLVKYLALESPNSPW